MIELIIDYATNKITGYNTVLPENADGAVLADDAEMPRLANVGPYDNLYYVDGKITEKEPDEYYQKLQKLNARHLKLQKELEKVEAKQDALAAEHEARSAAALLRRFEREEAAIGYQYFLSMVTVIRDENDYLEEWIRYHAEELGFDHFYIYDNESSVPAKTYLAKKNFRHLDKITFVPWKTTANTQQDSHNDFLKKYGKETRWFFPADPDEYVVIKDRSKTLKEFLAENSRYSVIECIWHHFNANGHEKKTEGTDMEKFTREADWHYGKCRGKRFAQSNRIQSMVNHVPQTRMGAEINSNLQEEFFQLNHYYTRSYEEWLRKMQRGSAVPYAKRKYSEFFELNPDMKYLDTGNDYAQGYGPPGRGQN